MGGITKSRELTPPASCSQQLEVVLSQVLGRGRHIKVVPNTDHLPRFGFNELATAEAMSRQHRRHIDLVLHGAYSGKRVERYLASVCMSSAVRYAD